VNPSQINSYPTNYLGSGVFNAILPSASLSLWLIL
jgi:hypothetical protein